MKSSYEKDLKVSIPLKSNLYNCILILNEPASSQEVLNGTWKLKTRLQAILDRAISNWYSYNVRALTIEMRALQFDQLSEQILFLFECVWCTLQSNDTLLHEIRIAVEQICISDLLTD